MIPFGAQLVGQTEKALNALLLTFLAETGVTEHGWVALRLTAQGGRVDAVLADADVVLADLEARGLVAHGGLTDDGQAFLEIIGQQVTEATRAIWEPLAADDVGATERVLNTVLERARSVLASLPPGRPMTAR